MTLNANDYASSESVRWCPGCGDYAVLKSMQKALATMQLKKSDCVFVSGIGCAGRFPYYLDTFGFHTVHGRAPTIATGLKLTRPELNVWVITGDGDGLSIGASHLMHIMRRNVNVTILLFNNQVYGLTKGQYSPTSPIGQRSKSTPYGSIDKPLKPLSVALAAGCSFVARGLDRNTKHLSDLLVSANAHNGTAFIEIYQNCPVFNDGVFSQFEHKGESNENMRYIQSDETFDYYEAMKIADSTEPTAFGIVYRDERPVYEEVAREAGSYDDLNKLLRGNQAWQV